MTTVLVLAAACPSRAPRPTSTPTSMPVIENRVPPAKTPTEVRIVVRDYSKRLAAGARVSVQVDGEWRELVTDERGEVSVAAPRGTRVSVTHHDMIGHGTIEGEMLEIVMMQAPM